MQLITAQAFVLTLLGTVMDNRVGHAVAERAERVAALTLCSLALALAEPLTSSRVASCVSRRSLTLVTRPT